MCVALKRKWRKNPICVAHEEECDAHLSYLRRIDQRCVAKAQCASDHVAHMTQMIFTICVASYLCALQKTKLRRTTWPIRRRFWPIQIFNLKTHRASSFSPLSLSRASLLTVSQTLKFPSLSRASLLTFSQTLKLYLSPQTLSLSGGSFTISGTDLRIDELNQIYECVHRSFQEQSWSM